MSRDRAPPGATELDELVRRLPSTVEPPPELWPRIAALLDAPRSLEARARELPTEIPPPADLWPRIAARLQTEPRRPYVRPRVAAAVAALAALGALIGLAVRDDSAEVGSADTARVAPDGAGADSVRSTALGAYWMLRSPVVSDEVAATLQRELVLVRDERLQIEAAIDREPDNVGLRELWAHAYEVELQLADAYGRTIMAYSRG